MLFEDLVLAMLIGVGVLIVGKPMFKLYRRLVPAELDPVAEAKKRLALAKEAAEAARLNKEAEHIVEELYDEELEQSQKEHSKL